MKTLNGSFKLRDASFSSYLRPHDHVRCSTIDHSAAELSIFDAHKYFNELSSSENQKGLTSDNGNRVSPVANGTVVDRSPDRSEFSPVQHRLSSDSSTVDSYANIRSYRVRSFHAATPTASSEASWNSQTGLLSHPPGAVAVSMRNSSSNGNSDKKSRTLISKPRWMSRRKCPCSGKKSVEVRDNLKTTPPQIPLPPLPPRLSSLSQVSTTPMMQLNNASMEKLTLNMEKTTLKPSHENFITPHNWVDKKEPEHSPMIMSDTHKPSPPEKHFSPTTIPPQRVIASGRAFVDHAASASGFTFPILNQHQSSKPLPIARLQSVNEVHEDPPRDSLEVFTPTEMDSNFTSLKNTTRDHQNFTFPTSPKSRIIDDDVASDASSDLFEIESFSTQTTSTYPMIYRHRDSLDEASNFYPTKSLGTPISRSVFLYGRRSLDETSSVAPTITECYEPSEASIEWSVTTAEGFDRASVTNYSVTASEIADHNDLLNMKEYHYQQSEKSKRRNSSGTGLLSCRCEKAVSVGPHPVKCVPGVEGHKGSTPFPWKPHVSSRPFTENKPPLARSHSARLSLAFAT